MAHSALLVGQMGTLSLGRSCRPTRMGTSNGSTSRTCMKARDSFHVEVNHFSTAAASGLSALSDRSLDSVLLNYLGYQPALRVTVFAASRLSPAELAFIWIEISPRSFFIRSSLERRSLGTARCADSDAPSWAATSSMRSESLACTAETH